MPPVHNTRSRDFFVIKIGFIAVGLIVLFGIAAMRDNAIRPPEKQEPRHVLVERVESKLPPRHIQGIAKDLNEGADAISSTDRLLDEVDVFGKKGSVDRVICPQFVLPLMPELPKLPPKDILESVTKDQLNFILYQHIKAHQERTIEVRRRLYRAYDDYLETCQ